jgi:hypothetical protein
MRLMEWLFGKDERVDELERTVRGLKAELGRMTRERSQMMRSLDMAWSLIRCLRDVNADLDGKLTRRDA